MTAALGNLTRRADPLAWLAGLTMAGLVASATVASWSSRPAALVLVVAALAAAAGASWRWPAPMLAVAGFFALADPYLIRAVLPPSDVGTLRYASETVAAAIGLPIAIRAAVEGRFIAAFRHPATLFLAAFLLVGVVSALVNAVPPLVAGTGLLVTLDAIAFFYLARMAGFTEHLVRRVLMVYVAIMLVASLLAIGQQVLAPDLLGFKAYPGNFGEGGRSTAFFGSPNQLGPLLGMAIPFPMLGIFETRDRRRQALLAGLCLLLGTAFWLTFSRGTWIGFIVGFGAVSLLVERRVLMLAAGVGIVSLLLAVFMPRNLAVGASAPNYATDRQDPDVLEGMGGRIAAIGQGTDLRILFIREGLPIAVDHPIVGVGPGRYGGAAANVFGTPVYGKYGISLHGFHTVHNYWLHLVVEFGMLGLLAMAGAMVVTVVPIIRAARRAPPGTRYLLMVLAIPVIAMSANSLTEMLLEGNTPSFSLWLVAGMGSVLAAGVISELASRHDLLPHAQDDAQVAPVGAHH
jgi:putative inorganic carbon (HCO3(-)) transporter